MKKRCPWADPENKLYVEYHDFEWGRPLHNDRKLFEMLILEGMQAGLSWATILKKRENFRKAFDNFDFNKVSGYKSKKVSALLEDAGIIRNRLKIESAIKNAKVFISIRREFGTFNKYIWGFIDGRPVVNAYRSLSEIPPETELSDIISRDLKKRGMSFVGSTIIYAYMQAVGMVNDHLTGCFRYRELYKE